MRDNQLFVNNVRTIIAAELEILGESKVLSAGFYDDMYTVTTNNKTYTAIFNSEDKVITIITHKKRDNGYITYHLDCTDVWVRVLPH